MCSMSYLQLLKNMGIKMMNKIIRFTLLNVDALFEISLMWKLDEYYITFWVGVFGKGFSIDIWRIGNV